MTRVSVATVVASGIMLAACGQARTGTPGPQAASATPAGRPPAAAAAPATAAAARATTAPGATVAPRAIVAAPAPLTLPAGTRVVVRLDRALSTVRNRAGDRFDATLDRPVTVAGTEALPVGTVFSGRVIASYPSGRLKGRAVLAMTLDRLDFDGHAYFIHASTDERVSAAHKKRDLEVIGGGSGLGALIGGLAGGGKGAGIGAAIGAAAGTGVAATTGKEQVELPAGTRFRFTLRRSVSVERARQAAPQPSGL